MARPSPSAEPYKNVAVIGAGAWGTTLALVANSAGAKVTLWAREPEVVKSLHAHRENRQFLKGIVVPDSITATNDLADSSAADIVILVAPAQHVRSMLLALKPHAPPSAPIIICAKGLELQTGLLLPEILAQMMPDASGGMLSGPSFARDVASGLPTAVTIAAPEKIASRLAASLGRPGFRPYVSEDVVGVALGGAAKNVYAIACGMVQGAGLGESARAATISRSFAELLRLGAALGAKSETLMGLSGLGDLVLTATSLTSRNFSLGVALGKGAALKDAAGPGRPLAEGAATAPALVARARKERVELPIAEAVADVLSGTLNIKGAVDRLLSRPLKPE